MYTTKEPWRRPVEIPHLPPLHYTSSPRTDRVGETEFAEDIPERATVDAC